MKNIHIKISLLCYLVCLAMPGYYIGERYEPQIGYEILLLGWLGPLGGHFAWYANLFFLFALKNQNQPDKSSILSIISLFLAASFLFYSKIMVSEAPTYKAIKAYGWGYGLWITSIAVFLIGQLLRSIEIKSERSENIALKSFLTTIILLSLYSYYYFVGKDSLFTIRVESKQEFQRRCATAGEKIFRTSNDVKGIFFDPDWQWFISVNRGIGGAGTLGDSHLGSGHLLFYETRDRKSPNHYRKYIFKDFTGKQTDQLESEYAVITESYKIPERLNISGATITIKDLRDNSVLATSTFFVENEKAVVCGNQKKVFSTSSFITKVLNLSKKYP